MAGAAQSQLNRRWARLRRQGLNRGTGAQSSTTRLVSSPARRTTPSITALPRAGGRARPHRLADDLRLSRSSLSRRIDRLEEEAWVARSRPPAPADHRAVVVELTPRGRALWRAMNVTYRRAVQRLVATALDDDATVGQLRGVLARLDPHDAADPTPDT